MRRKPGEIGARLRVVRGEPQCVLKTGAICIGFSVAASRTPR